MSFFFVIMAGSIAESLSSNASFLLDQTNDIGTAKILPFLFACCFFSLSSSYDHEIYEIYARQTEQLDWLHK